jgi:hypothetical protein
MGQGSVCPAPGFGGALDVTRIYPIEPANSGTTPITGFARQWLLQFNDTSGGGGCKSGVPCSQPASGTKIHLLFSHVPSGNTVHRVNGQPVQDNQITMTIP